MGKVTSISGELIPEPSIRLLATFHLPSFDATVTGRSVVLAPRSDVTMDGREGSDRAKHEIGALLAALGAESGEPLHFRIMETTEVDEEGGIQVSDHAFVSDSVTDSISLGPESLERLFRQVEWAAEDLLYRELLALLLLARRARNPRPSVYNMVERLERKYGSRSDACRALGIPHAVLTPAVRDQGDYEGDRHSTHTAGTTRPNIPDTLRTEVLEVAARLVRAYEEATWPSR